ncbi:hypothetical protein HanOQP8_Chr10g0372351 [Helianthus annuus]|nr:hypothetical protein HanOQP8_Chr10g0372351 [Helianthus annuus]KAJ0884432.1 putative Dynamin superfamily [Helianthus annuus]
MEKNQTLDFDCKNSNVLLHTTSNTKKKKNKNLWFSYTDGIKTGDMDGNVGFHAILRRSYSCFIKDLAKQRKQLIRQHLDPVTSPYSQACYETDLLFGLGSNSTFCYQTSCLDFSDQENMPPVNNNIRIRKRI